LEGTKLVELLKKSCTKYIHNETTKVLGESFGQAAETIRFAEILRNMLVKKKNIHKQT